MLVEVRRILKKAKVPFVLIGSTLLGIYRDGEPIGEVQEAGILDDDLKTTLERIKKIHPNTTTRMQGDDILIIDMNDIGGKTFELHPIHFSKRYAYLYVALNNYLVWEKDILEKWGSIKYAGLKWNIPSKTEDFLEAFYGKDWRTPQPSFWRNAPNLHVVM